MHICNKSPINSEQTRAAAAVQAQGAVARAPKGVSPGPLSPSGGPSRQATAHTLSDDPPCQPQRRRAGARRVRARPARQGKGADGAL